MRLLNAYIRSSVISSIVIVLVVVTGLEILIEFLNQLNSIASGNYTVFAAVLYVAMKLPMDVYQFFPMAGFLGCLIGLGRLASSSELVVMRAAGVSVIQITWLVIRAACYLIVVMTLLGEFVAPVAAAEADHYKNRLIHEVKRKLLARHIWLKEGQEFVFINAVPSKKRIEGVTVFSRKGETELQAVGYAPFGVYQSGVWHLKDFRQTVFGADVLSKRGQPDKAMDFQLNFRLLKNDTDEIDRESAAKLLVSKQYRAQQGLDSARYELAFWLRVIQPLTSIIMICLGVPFMFGSLRQMTLGTRIVMGVAVGFAFYMLNQFFGPMTLVYQWSPLLVAVLPALFFGSVCVVLLARTR